MADAVDDISRKQLVTRPDSGVLPPAAGSSSEPFFRQTLCCQATVTLVQMFSRGSSPRSAATLIVVPLESLTMK